ncbi:Crp/Fnr family transcriptional regulator [Acinetobacter sp.]|uniref:Crp/Fnr family transcriptional regulator n=1 Tax=Acinetobacter sp. TaxID=472 RepID=UPI002647191B|nr:Crp/Fnr family transcriptional regulator [Acinetobacter sp.]MDN5512195.1 Crp/Fnr family transcriptional regulator [Acinetobacter sp.]MDN5524571.1 Crp/Fnr family transcriptional regulator [Acinetobacter sp.]
MLESIYIDHLEQNVWFTQLPVLFKDFIVNSAVQQYFDKEQTIFHAGDPFNGIYAVLEGAVRLGYIDIHGKAAVAAIVEPIMWFGEISLVDAKPRSHDAITTQKSLILHIPSTALQLLLQQHPVFWYHIAQLTSQKLRFAFLELISIQTQNMTQRLAQRLLFILNGYGNHLSIEKNVIHLSQEQLAQMLTCSRQTINQELQALEQQNILRLSFKKIEILNLAELHRIGHAFPEF